MAENYNGWCQNMMRMLAVGGTWAVPRSGLIFTKADEQTLVLTERIPGIGLQAQEDDFVAIREHFKDAGFMVKPHRIS